MIRWINEKQGYLAILLFITFYAVSGCSSSVTVTQIDNGSSSGKIMKIPGPESALLKKGIYLEASPSTVFKGVMLEKRESVEYFLKHHMSCELNKHTLISAYLDASVSELKRRTPVYVPEDITISILDQINAIAEQVKLKYTVYKKTVKYDNVENPITYVTIRFSETESDKKYLDLSPKEFNGEESGEFVSFMGYEPGCRSVFPIGMYLGLKIKYNILTSDRFKIQVLGKDSSGNIVTHPLYQYAGNIQQNDQVGIYNITCLREAVINKIRIKIIKLDAQGQNAGTIGLEFPVDIKFQQESSGALPWVITLKK